MRARALVVVGLFWTWCAGCVPDEVPCYTNDGKTVVAMAYDATGTLLLWTVDVKSGAVETFRPPDGWVFDDAKVLGGQIWVFSHLPSPVRRGDWDDETVRRFDPVKKTFVPGPRELEGTYWTPWVVPACVEGKKCLLVSASGPTAREGDYDVFSLPEMKKGKTIHAGSLITAGNFWWLKVVHKHVADETRIDRIELHDPHGKRGVSIRPEDMEQDEWVVESLHYARVSEDGKTLLLVFGGKNGIYGFSVFDVATGKYLWGRRGECEFIVGRPLIGRNEIWTMEFTEDDKAIALVRYWAGAEPDVHKTYREEFPVYSTKTMNLEERHAITCTGAEFIDQFTPSPDGSHFVMVINGSPSRLLFIPIRKDVKEKDVRIIELVEKKAAGG